MANSPISTPMEPGTHVTLNDKATQKVRQYLTRDGNKGSMLRISLVRTHCMMGRGHSYKFIPEREPADGDEVQEAQGLKVVLSKDQIPLLEGTVIDYEEGLEESGFTITNPQATGKCPCGHHDLFD
ncbi:MAG: HesB/IscA family protein [Thermoplasmata archaeon]